MDFGDLMEELVQLVLVAAAALVLGRAGLALARIAERHFSEHRGLNPETEGRLLLLEEEYNSLRRDLTELRDRQDFMDRLFLRDPADRPSPPRFPGSTP
ncbi:MAG: hypothetical protein ACREMX_02610 [Gemmatimonadales bacterium]